MFVPKHNTRPFFNISVYVPNTLDIITLTKLIITMDVVYTFSAITTIFFITNFIFNQCYFQGMVIVGSNVISYWQKGKTLVYLTIRTTTSTFTFL